MLAGSASISVRMVEPVVVYPDTLSNHELMTVNSPPYIIYGSEPNTKEKSQERTMVRKLSFMLKVNLPLTKISGKTPVRVVIAILMRSGAKPSSTPYPTETIKAMNMNNALIRRTFPT